MNWMIPKGKWGLAGRALLAAFIVIACTAGATAVAGLLQVKNLVTDLNHTPALKHTGVTLPKPGAPQTLLLIGADRRIGETANNVGNTDTMMLVRLNPNSSTINLLSIPRDLQVQAPGGGVEKLNSVYSQSGPAGLIDTLNAQVFPGIKGTINHVIVVSFLGFAHLIDDIGCIYAPVDQRYYNHNDLVGGTDPTNFSNIDIQPGYQQLCGGDGGATSALAFVRYRHTDTDQVRNARQQDFLRWAKDQFSTSYLESNYSRLALDFGKNVQTDSILHSNDGLIELFDLLLNADGHQVKTIQYAEGYSVVGGADYVVPTSPGEYADAFKRFMTPTVAKPSAAHHAGQRINRPKGPFTVPAGMSDGTSAGVQQAQHLGNTGIPIYYPREIPSNYAYCLYQEENCSEGFEPATAYQDSYPRNYTVTGRDGHQYHAWAMTLLYNGYNDPNANLATGDYFNVQGLQWRTPPLLNKPTQIETVNGKRLLIYAQGGLISTVAWETQNAVYWIQNTLENTIPNKQMVAMAATFTRYH